MLNRFPTSLILSFAALGGLTAGVCEAQADPQPQSERDALKSAVQNYILTSTSGDPQSERYIFEFIDLAGHGKQQAVSSFGWKELVRLRRL